jgi:hypothetical protein
VIVEPRRERVLVPVRVPKIHHLLLELNHAALAHGPNEITLSAAFTAALASTTRRAVPSDVARLAAVVTGAILTTTILQGISVGSGLGDAFVDTRDTRQSFRPGRPPGPITRRGCVVQHLATPAFAPSVATITETSTITEASSVTEACTQIFFNKIYKAVNGVNKKEPPPPLPPLPRSLKPPMGC